jgi:hypothetical protein
MSTQMLNDLLSYCTSNGRVCPLPRKWDRLWKMLPNTRRVGAGWEPSLPLILAAWDSPDDMKSDRLKTHIEWAHQQQALERVDEYLRSVLEEDWLHKGES